MELTTPLRYEPLDNAEVASERLRFFQTPVLLQYWRSLLRHKWIVASILLGTRLERFDRPDPRFEPGRHQLYQSRSGPFGQNRQCLGAAVYRLES